MDGILLNDLCLLFVALGLDCTLDNNTGLRVALDKDGILLSEW